ncbi:hypothetical protein RB598_004238 [Gaeumannomyces tritici]
MPSPRIRGLATAAGIRARFLHHTDRPFWFLFCIDRSIIFSVPTVCLLLFLRSSPLLGHFKPISIISLPLSQVHKMQFSKIQIFAILAVGAMANPVPADSPTDAATLQVRDETHLLVARNCEGRSTKASCEKFLSGCKWLHSSNYCVGK